MRRLEYVIYDNIALRTVEMIYQTEASYIYYS